jgi:hypothetical protein
MAGWLRFPDLFDAHSGFLTNRNVNIHVRLGGDGAAIGSSTNNADSMNSFSEIHR